MPLFDAYGRPIQADITAKQTPPQQETLEHKSPKESSEQWGKRSSGSESRWGWWITGWRLGIEIATLLGLALAIYMLRPILSVTSLTPTGIDGRYGAKVGITTSPTAISNVLVQCITNKVIIDNKYTLDMSRFSRVDEYSVGDVRAGESFSVGCTFAWSMWTYEDNGILILGYPTPGRPHIGIKYKVVKGLPVLIGAVPTAVIFEFGDSVKYRLVKPTHVDASFVIRYTWPFCPIPQKRTIHMIESPGIDGTAWRVAPESEGVIPDAKDPTGWTLSAKPHGADFTITLKGGTFVPE